ncbi:hypothetical protein [Delftia sp. DT-2]|uniref:hypothetical protein n=1 Tax=Delftia sp. DT-2 TaxID=3022772 RepID=UPI00233F7764|nr:hypothetical protein [Delftia sp. DT-2]MDC2862019.1 hypothetical protein [Delftia sp. DT-2]
MFDLNKLKKQQKTNEWFSQAEDGAELFLCGTDEGPSIAALEDAKIIISEYYLIRKKSIALLESFMKDSGEWFLNSIIIGPFQSQKDGDFRVELGFEADRNKNEYSYTGFTVYFTLNKEGRHLGLISHPFKFSVEFS